MAGRKLGRGNGAPCRGELANGQPCMTKAFQGGVFCVHCSARETDRLANVFVDEDYERVTVTLELPAIGDLTYAPREELFGLALYLRETNPRVTMPRVQAA